MKNLTMDRGVIAWGQSINPDQLQWSDQNFVKYFGSTLRYRFNSYKHLTFNFIDHTTGLSHIVNGFADWTGFSDFMGTTLSDGVNYHSVELILTMEFDEKIKEPTLYAKNRVVGGFNAGKKYRRAKFVEQDRGSGWYYASVPSFLRNIWLSIFGEDLTENFIKANNSIKRCFWLKKDPDRGGVIKGGMILDDSHGNNRIMYNSTDSVPGNPGTLVTGETSDVWGDGQDLVAGNNNPPKYYIIGDNNSLVIESHMATDAQGGRDYGTRMSGLYRSLNGQNYSVVAVNGVQNSVAGKTLRALHISPVGVDTFYCDFIDSKKYRVWAVKKFDNGQMSMKELSFSTDGFQRLGRWGIGDIMNFDNDTGSESVAKGQYSIYFVYQEINSGKFSRFSQQVVRDIKDLRFRLPIFRLTAE